MKTAKENVYLINEGNKFNHLIYNNIFNLKQKSLTFNYLNKKGSTSIAT
jgi:hypothetical protein